MRHGLMYSEAESSGDAAAQVLHHSIRSFGHDSSSGGAERIPFQTETPTGQNSSTLPTSEVRGGGGWVVERVETHLRLVHRPSSGGIFSRSLLDRSRVDK